MTCGSLVVASGGLSIPKKGATGFGYKLARRFGHAVHPTRAGLVPFTFDAGPPTGFHDLKGVSLPVRAEASGRAFEGGMLFTHRGLSGPAVLQTSSYWQPGDTVHIDMLAGADAGAWLLARKRECPDIELQKVLAEALPKRLAQRVCELAMPSRALHHIPDRGLLALAERLAAWPFVPADTEGYRTAEVTLGGVDTNELSSTTMMSKCVPELYFIGEVVDVTGHLGGFNFQWAWSSGHAAGQVV